MARRRTPGLRKRGRIWNIDKRIRGYGALRESTGTDDLEEAERYLARRLEGIRQATIYGVRPKRIFREAAEHYVRTSTKRSLGRDVQDLRLVLPYIGDLALQQIHDGTLAPFVEARLADGKAAGTINRTLAVVHRILTLAARAWRDEHGLTWLESAPLLTLQRGPKRQGHILSVEEQERFLARLPEHLSEMALFGLHTGCRQGEIVGLRWEWIVERDGIRYVALPGHVTKNGESRPVVLNRVAAGIVDACRGRHSTHVFTYQPRGDRVCHPVERLRNSAWRRARAAVGLPGLQVHDLRRTFATRLRDAGVPKWTVSACLGHKDGGVTELYALPTLRELRAAIETLEEVDHRRSPRSSSVISSSMHNRAEAETYGTD